MTGDTSVTEGNNASYTFKLRGKHASGFTASVQINLTDIDTSATDLETGTANETELYNAIAAAVASRADLSFNTTTGVLTFTSQSNGDKMENLVVNLAAADESLVELDEDYNIALSNAVNSRIKASLDDVTTTIVDNDAAQVSIDDVALAEGDSGTTTYSFTVSLDNPVDNDVTMNWATAHSTTDGSDLSPQSGTVTITAGSTSSDN